MRGLMMTVVALLFLVPTAGAQSKIEVKTKCPQCGTHFVAEAPVPSGMALVPAGNFKMGCNKKVDKECKASEKPYHEVYLSSFFIDKTEVTVNDYSQCIEAGACTTPLTAKENQYCNYGQEFRDHHPINCVEWLQANQYCQWAGKRLPTEAEWEKSARGTDGRKHPWGAEKASCNFAILGISGQGCGKPGTWKTCAKIKGNSPYDLCDMVGNVWEWVSDWYEEDYYSHSPKMNPRGPRTGKTHVLRGGAWTSKLSETPRTSNRFFFMPGSSLANFGFRCAADLK